MTMRITQYMDGMGKDSTHEYPTDQLSQAVSGLQRQVSNNRSLQLGDTVTRSIGIYPPIYLSIYLSVCLSPKWV